MSSRRRTRSTVGRASQTATRPAAPPRGPSAASPGEGGGEDTRAPAWGLQERGRAGGLGTRPQELGEAGQTLGGVARAEPAEPRPPATSDPSRRPATARAGAPADLQVCDVPVDVHGGRHAVLRHVLVVAGARLAVHAVDTGDGDPLIAPSDVPATGGASAPGKPGSLPHLRLPGGRSQPLLAHLLTVFSTGVGLSGAASRSAWLTCRALHTWELRLAHCRGVSPSLFFRVTSESRDRKRLHREQVRRTLSPSVQDSRTRRTQRAHP